MASLENADPSLTSGSPLVPLLEPELLLPASPLRAARTAPPTTVPITQLLPRQTTPPTSSAPGAAIGSLVASRCSRIQLLKAAWQHAILALQPVIAAC